MTTATQQPAVGKAPLDWGRTAMVPLFALLLLANLTRLPASLNAGTDAAQTALTFLTSAVTFAFYAVVIVAYLRRGAASATTSSLPARAAAVVATCLPLTLPLLGSAQLPTGRTLAAAALIVAGTTWSLWALRILGSNLSVFAQARGLVTSGPYAWIRHPLYVGEIVATFGIAVRIGTAAVFALWVLLVGLQAFRALAEERLLSDALPGYPDYVRRTARLVPGLF